MREHGIRFVQVARHGHRETDGITVLDDSHAPTKVFLEGDYTLSHELRTQGTVPTFTGVHKCALKFKAFVIERWLATNLGSSVQHAIGYNTEETSRIAKSEYAFEAAARVAFGFNAEETARVERAGEYDGLRGPAQPAPAHEIAFGYNAEE
ncbi:MAG TPA: hypothetical protein VFE22_02915, partial [Edaphobacter sp.]|nr:hypothetical protein [Edaphobacter sp.]